MARIGSGDKPAGQLAGVMVKHHLDELRADPRRLSGRATGIEAGEYAADRAERRPAKQSGTENAERNRDRELTPQADEGSDRERNHTADDLEGAREHRGIGGAEHLQEQVENDDGNGARDQSHAANINGLSSKSRDHFIWPSNLAAPPSLADSRFSASRPPAA